MWFDETRSLEKSLWTLKILCPKKTESNLKKIMLKSLKWLFINVYFHLNWADYKGLMVRANDSLLEKKGGYNIDINTLVWLWSIEKIKGRLYYTICVCVCVCMYVYIHSIVNILYSISIIFYILCICFYSFLK